MEGVAGIILLVFPALLPTLLRKQWLNLLFRVNRRNPPGNSFAPGLLQPTTVFMLVGSAF